VVSADKMMIKARGPVWHKKQKTQGLVPKGLTGLDRDATWSYSKADSWVYGHGTFCVTTHHKAVLGLFIWMPNSAHEGKRLGEELPPFYRLLNTVCMDSKADNQKLYFALQQVGLQLLTRPRTGKDKALKRQQMIREMNTRARRKLYRERGQVVEPMQGLVKELFDLERCWMRGNANNRWLFAAMGVAVQMAQRRAFAKRQSTWNIRLAVLGS
jgi:hypothetical protein